MTQTATVWRMEKGGHGPFSQDTIDETTEIAAKGEIPWARTDSNLFAIWIEPDDTHPHHFEDVLGGHVDGSGTFEETDDEIMLPGRWLVGVKDIPQFLHWFPKESLHDFEADGFRAAEYEVPAEALRSGTYQVMFRKSAAKLVKALKPTEIINEEEVK